MVRELLDTEALAVGAMLFMFLIVLFV